MSWKEDSKRVLDVTYELVKRKVPDIKFPCYGGRFYWSFCSYHSEYLYFYLTNDSLIYTASSAYITEIPFNDIKKLSIKRDVLVKTVYHIRLVADKKYHLFIYCRENFSTELTSDESENVKSFINTLQRNYKGENHAIQT